MPLSDNSQFSALLTQAGIDPKTAEAVMDIDWVLQRWRRRAMKRELGTRALQDLKVGLDLAQYDVLSAIVGPPGDREPGEDEVMVSSVAERLSIDPSRASRLVGDMVDQGFARRAVSQADARRTIIELTERGLAVVDAVRAYKFLIMGDFLAEWDKDELTQFVPLLKRFTRWIDGIDPSSEKHAKEIAELARGIESPAGQKEPA